VIQEIAKVKPQKTPHNLIIKTNPKEVIIYINALEQA